MLPVQAVSRVQRRRSLVPAPVSPRGRVIVPCNCEGNRRSCSHSCQIHHGISCTDIVRTKAVLRTIGFTDHQPGAPEPLIYRNVEDDFIGQVTAPVLGDEYHTHYVENPVTGQQIDLIEIQPAGLKTRDWRHPAQGDLIIGIQVEDPLDAYRAMQAADPDCRYSDPVACDEEDGLLFDWRDGQRSILTTRAAFRHSALLTGRFSPGETVLRGGARRPVAPVADAGDQRYRLQGIDGRVDVVVTPDARRLAVCRMGQALSRCQSLSPGRPAISPPSAGASKLPVSAATSSSQRRVRVPARPGRRGHRDLR